MDNFGGGAMKNEKAIEVLQNIVTDKNSWLLQPMRPNDRKRIKEEVEALTQAIRLMQWRETVKQENQSKMF